MNTAESILKTLREKAGLTQEQAAEESGVSVSSIQGWERSGKIPKESLHRLLDIYQTDQVTRDRAVLEIFGEKKDSVGNAGAADNFPYFLFDNEKQEQIRKMIRNMTLSPEEMEIFGYCHYLDSKEYHDDYSSITFPQVLDYRFMTDHGGVLATLRKIDIITSKIGWSDDVQEVVYDYGKRHPGEGFTLAGRPAKDLRWLVNRFGNVDIEHLHDLCICLYRPCDITDRYDDTNPDEVNDVISYDYYNIPKLRSVSDITGRCIEITRKENETDAYQKKKTQYEADLKAYNEHPSLYEREPEFKAEYRYYLKRTDIGTQFLKWYNE